MKFIPVDRKTWKRESTYLRFTKQVPCTFDMTVNLDITKFLQRKGQDVKFFPALLYCISRAVNLRKEFRMTKKDGTLGYYDEINPQYTVFDENTQTFHTRIVEYSEDFKKFYSDYLSEKSLSETTAVFDVSCIPWATFTSFQLNLGAGFDYFLPIFTIGKYFMQEQKTLLPFAMHVHHAVCDGFHASEFVGLLQKLLDNFPCNEKF